LTTVSKGPISFFQNISGKIEEYYEQATRAQEGKENAKRLADV
jgi:hypothetical protein